MAVSESRSDYKAFVNDACYQIAITELLCQVTFTKRAMQWLIIKQKSVHTLKEAPLKMDTLGSIPVSCKRGEYVSPCRCEHLLKILKKLSLNTKQRILRCFNNFHFS